MDTQISPSPRDWRWLLPLVALVVLAADQASKSAIIARLALGESWRPWADTPLLDLFAFTHTKNTGAAFGMFQEGGWLFVIVALVVTSAIFWKFPSLPRSEWWRFLALGLVQGGALGNLVDRLRIGHVTDFVHIGSFAIFNVADAAIFCGVLLLGFMTWQEEEREKRRGAATAGHISEGVEEPMSEQMGAQDEEPMSYPESAATR